MVQMIKWILIGAVSLLFANTNSAQTPSDFSLVNTPYDEQNPVISPDGKVLYLTIGKHPQNVGGKKDPGDIWVSLKIDGKWQAPIHGGSQINNANYNAVAGFSFDGNQMILLGHYTKDGNITTQGISVAEKEANGWSFPKNRGIPYFKNQSEEWSGFLSENAFVFSADSYGSRGAEDIYVSLVKDGRWQEPINLGKVINTPLQEFTPSLSIDGRTLYFASNGHQGLGSFDIYKSERLDDAWTNWSVPVNLGETVNSESRELYYRITNSGVLYTSTRDSNGYGDIRKLLETTEPLPKVDTLIRLVEKIPDTELQNQVIITGKVTNSKTKAGITASIRFKADTTIVVQSTANGLYQATIPSGKVFTIELESKGFVNRIEKLDIRTLQLKKLELNFQLQPIEVGTLVSLKSILFNMGTTTLLEESYPELDAVVDFMKSNPKVEIELEGHTDNRGDAKKNLVLSKERVDRIKAYLVSKGVASRRIRGKGFGGTKPIATNDSEEARKLNRRVEFLIVKN
jgi:OmpA-OmpF porin, OOP family